jgi:hypothetical protein
MPAGLAGLLTLVGIQSHGGGPMNPRAEPRRIDMAADDRGEQAFLPMLYGCPDPWWLARVVVARWCLDMETSWSEAVPEVAQRSCR